MHCDKTYTLQEFFNKDGAIILLVKSISDICKTVFVIEVCKVANAHS